MRMKHLVATLVIAVSAAGCATQSTTTRPPSAKQSAAPTTLAPTGTAGAPGEVLVQEFINGPATVNIATQYAGSCHIKAAFLTVFDPSYVIYFRILSNDVFDSNGIEFEEAKYFSCARDSDTMYTCTPHDPPPWPFNWHKYTIRIVGCEALDPFVVNY